MFITKILFKIRIHVNNNRKQLHDYEIPSDLSPEPFPASLHPSGTACGTACRRTLRAAADPYSRREAIAAVHSRLAAEKT